MCTPQHIMRIVYVTVIFTCFCKTECCSRLKVTSNGSLADDNHEKSILGTYTIGLDLIDEKPVYKQRSGPGILKFSDSRHEWTVSQYLNTANMK